jgi:hypothetical protein
MFNKDFADMTSAGCKPASHWLGLARMLQV